jgi:long-chain fatty acid transport protein
VPEIDTMHTASRLTFTALALGVAGILAAGQADASGFQIRENSVKNLGRANAGTTVAWGDASVVLNNPAAMVNLKQTTVQADVTVIDLTADFKGSGTTALGAPAGPLTGGNGGDPGDATAVPAMAAVFPLHGSLEGMVLGASISAPFGLKTEYDPTWMGRYDAITSDVKIVDLTLSAGYAFTDRFSLGVGVIAQRADVTLSKAIDFGTALCAATNPLNCFNPAYPFHPQKQDGSIEVSGADTDFGFVLGAQFKATDNLTFGYAHRTEIHHTLTGTADFTMPASVAATLGALHNHGYDDGPIWANLDTPATDTVSVLWNVHPGFRLLADAQLTGWSSLQSVDIYRDGGAPVGNEAFDWKDSWFYSVGGEWDLSDAFTFRAGIGYDETPTHDDTRTPRLPDNNRTVYTAGLTWNVTPQLSVDAAYMRVQIDSPSVNTTSSSHSHLVGEFTGHADLVGVSAQYRF